MTRWRAETAEAYGELGEQGHVPILKPVVGELLGDLEGRRALDFACGPGDFSVVLAELGAAVVVGIDQSAEMIERARSKSEAFESGLARRLRFVVGDESDLVERAHYDVVMCSLALMMSSTRDKLRCVCAALLRSLVPAGRLLVFLTHPCFRASDYGTFHYRMSPSFSYWCSGDPYDVVLTPDGQGESVVITDHHWTLEDYVTALTACGGAVTAVRELPARRSAGGEFVGAPAYLALLIRRT